jgi:WD40 repeat protein/DNA-binding SARP family transcriptional activator
VGSLLEGAMLEVRLLGQFSVTAGSDAVEIPSRPAQSLFAYLILNAGIPQRRERLSGLFWPKSTVENARGNLRHALWRVRKALNACSACPRDIISADDFTISFDAAADYWLDTAVLEHQGQEETTADALLTTVSVYCGELLPGFYDSWVLLERERLQAIFARKMGLLMQYLLAEQRWQEVLRQGERWIALGYSPENAYFALMVAHCALGDSSLMAAVYQRCRKDLQEQLGVQPAPQTIELYDQLSQGVLPQVALPVFPGDGAAEGSILGEPSAPEMTPKVHEARDLSREDAGRSELELKTLQKQLETAQDLAAQEKNRAQEMADASRQLRRSSSWLVLLLLLAIVSAFLALQQVELARQQARLSQARELAAVAMNQLQNDPERSLLLTLEAMNVNELILPEMSSAFRQALQAMRVLLTVPGTGGVAFCPDGRTIATTDLDHTAKIWNATTGDVLISLKGHTDAVLNVAFSPDGRHLITTSLDQEAKIWDVYTGQEELSLTGHEAGVISPAFSPDGSLIVTTSYDGTAKIWDANTGQELLSLARSGISTGAEFSPDSAQVIIADHDAFAARVWDITSGDQLLHLEGHTEGVNDAAFSPDGNRLVTASNDATVKVWDAADGDLIFTLFHGSAVFDVDYSADGSQVATAGQNGSIKIWDSDTGQEILQLPGHTAGTTNIAFSLDGKRLVSGGAETKVWDISPGGNRDFLTIDAHDDLVFGIAYDHAGDRLASSSWDGTVKIWDATSGDLLQTMDGHDGRVAFISFNPDGDRLATAGYDGTARLWDTESGEELFRLFPAPAQDRAASSQRADEQARSDMPWVFGIDFSPDGRHLVTTSRAGTAEIWDAAIGQEQLSFVGHTGALFRASFSPDGRTVATAGEDGTARIWDFSSGEELLRLDGHQDWVTSAVFSPDGQLLATSSFDKSVRLWDAATGEELLLLHGHTAAIWDVIFSPDGNHLFSTGFDNTVRQWDVVTGKEMNTLFNSDMGPDLAISPDGKHLATTSTSGLIRITILSLEELMEIARSRLTRSLTEEECQEFLHLASCPTSP